MEGSFEEWMKQVDRMCSSRLLVSVYDLPDRLYRDMYDDGYSPEEVVADIQDEYPEALYDSLEAFFE